MKAWINQIQRFSIHDGPGIRTTIFFQGCNLRCGWCHNPDTISRTPVFTYVEARCLRCGVCAGSCPSGALEWSGGRPLWRPDRCTFCAACEGACPAGACGISARSMTVGEVLEAAERDIPFYQSSAGGITCSGGEAMLQAEFLAELLKRARALGIHTAVDTAALVPWERFEPLLDVADLFLVDFKLYGRENHEAATGRPNGVILENLRKFASCPVPVTVRIPVIPGVNADPDTLAEMGAFLAEIGFGGQVELLKFHNLGNSKYGALGLENPFAHTVPPEDGEMARYREILAGQNLNIVMDT